MMFKAAPTVNFAAQSDQETGTSTTLAVTPGRQQYHASASKVWCNLNGQGTIAIIASYNTTSITDLGTGSYRITFDTDFSSANWGYAGGVETEGTQNVGVYSTARASGSQDILVYRRDTGAAIDVPSVCIAYFGDQ